MEEQEKLLEKQKACNHQRVAFILASHRFIPKGYQWLSTQDDVDLEDFEQVDFISRAVCLDCDLQLEVQK